MKTRELEKKQFNRLFMYFKTDFDRFTPIYINIVVNGGSIRAPFSCLP
jgi:hypothetical protein